MFSKVIPSKERRSEIRSLGLWLESSRIALAFGSGGTWHRMPAALCRKARAMPLSSGIPSTRNWHITTEARSSPSRSMFEPPSSETPGGREFTPYAAEMLRLKPHPCPLTPQPPPANTDAPRRKGG